MESLGSRLTISISLIVRPIFYVYPAALSKNRTWTLSLGKLVPNCSASPDGQNSASWLSVMMYQRNLLFPCSQVCEQSYVPEQSDWCNNMPIGPSFTSEGLQTIFWRGRRVHTENWGSGVRLVWKETHDNLGHCEAEEVTSLTFSNWHSLKSCIEHVHNPLVISHNHSIQKVDRAGSRRRGSPM